MGLFSSNKAVTFTVAEMNCGHCEARITKLVETLPNVKKVKATSANKQLTIEYVGDAAPDLTTVNAALEGSGYVAALS